MVYGSLNKAETGTFRESAQFDQKNAKYITFMSRYNKNDLRSTLDPPR